VLAASQPAHSHGIAGNRYFAGTMTFDDPAVSDDAIVPYYSYFAQPLQDSNVIENRIDWSFARLLTPTLAITYDSGWIHQNWPIGPTSGFDSTDIGLKYAAYRDNQHETLVAVSVAWGIGHSGAQAVGADNPIRFNRVFSLERALVISVMSFLGCGPSPLPERSWMSIRLVPVGQLSLQT
jgi:hypothetical protein